MKHLGIDTTYITLHTGLSSYMDDQLDLEHPASEEEYFISTTTARKISDVRKKGGRIIAVGTTVVRALESAILNGDHIAPGHNYTRLYIVGTVTRETNISLSVGTINSL